MMVITKEFVLATIEGIHGLRWTARELENDKNLNNDQGAGRILRHRAEGAKQSADLLAGWVRRYADQAGLNHNDYDLDN